MAPGGRGTDGGISVRGGRTPIAVQYTTAVFTNIMAPLATTATQANNSPSHI